MNDVTRSMAEPAGRRAGAGRRGGGPPAEATGPACAAGAGGGAAPTEAGVAAELKPRKRAKREVVFTIHEVYAAPGTGDPDAVVKALEVILR